jgi:cell division protein FtsL
MADLDDLMERVNTLQTKVSRLEFAVLFMLVVMFLLFSISIYFRR